MTPKKWTYYLSKFTLIDEILGFIYWALAIYGMFLVAGCVKSSTVMIFAIFIYIVAVSVFYVIVLKKIKSYFKGESE